MLKQRRPEQVRVDALQMGIKKAQSGCPTCAEKYFELAKQHGATEQEIQSALEQAAGMSKKGFNRRELLQYVVAGGLAVTATGLLSVKKPDTAMAASYYFAVDSNTTNCCYMPLNFYIGRMGQGTSADTSYFAFNTSMASQVGWANTFGYWGVLGPTAGGGQSPYNWGVSQANAAWNAWNYAFVGANYVGGLTIFGDLETGFGGWGSNQGNNLQVVNGFINQLHTLYSEGGFSAWPGLYVSSSFWNSYLGSGSVPQTNTGWVLWITGTYECYVCNPCGACTTTVSDAEYYFSNYVSGIVLGGQHPILWQYWLTNPGCDNSGCGDWDISTRLSRAIQPAN